MINEIINNLKKYNRNTIDDYIYAIYQSEYIDNIVFKHYNDSYKDIISDVNTKNNSIIDEDLYDFISEELVRINLRVYYKYNLDFHKLSKAYLMTKELRKADKNNFLRKLNYFKNANINYKTKSDLELINKYINLIEVGDNFEFGHSTKYINNYNPNYRIIDKQFLTNHMKYIQIKNFINNMLSKKNTLKIAIDGKCASGKTTISNLLQEDFNATIIHVDDFFLEKQMKTKERLEEIGGNIQSDLLSEVINKIEVGKPFTYDIFNCKTQSYQTKTEAKVNPIIIVEGVYSMHDKLIQEYDGTIYLDIDSENQMNRLKDRCNEDLLKKFINEWIPLENKYFSNKKIMFKANIIA